MSNVYLAILLLDDSHPVPRSQCLAKVVSKEWEKGKQGNGKGNKGKKQNKEKI